MTGVFVSITKRSDSVRIPKEIKAVYNHIEMIFGKILDSMEASDIVIDIGSGSGSFNYDSYTFQIIALDINKPSKINKRASYIIADANFLPFKSAVFDLMIFCHVFEHLQQPEKSMQEANRTLKREGHLYCAIPDGYCINDRVFRLLGFLIKGRSSHIQKLSLSEFCRLMYDVGFKLHTYHDYLSLFTWIKPLALRILVIKITLLMDRLFHTKFSRYGWHFLFAKC